MTILMVISIGFVLFGILLIARSFFGLPIDDHPRCRRCGYDLFGSIGQSNVCSECGTDISSPGSIRSARRRVRMRPLVAGICIALIASVQSIWFSHLISSGVTLGDFVPSTFWLWRAQSENADVRNRAIEILIDRDTRAKRGGPSMDLSDDVRNSLLDQIIRLQGDTTVPWQPAWGDYLENARSASMLDDLRWRRYSAQTIIGLAQLRVRPLVTRGDSIPVELVQPNGFSGRAGPHGRFRIDCRFDLLIDGTQVGADFSGGGEMQIGLRSAVYIDPGYEESERPKPIEIFGKGKALGESLADGTHEMTVNLAWEIWEEVGVQPTPIIVANVRSQAAASFTILPIGTPSYRLLNPKDLPFPIGAKIHVLFVGQGVLPPPSPFTRDFFPSRPWPTTLYVSYRMDPLPVRILHDLILTDGTHEWKLHTTAYDTVAHFGDGWGVAEAPEFTGETIDLALRPNIERIRESVDNSEVVDDVRIRDLPVQRPQQSVRTNPTAP